MKRLAILAAMALTACDAGPPSRGDLNQERMERLDTDDALRSELRELKDRVDRLESQKRVATREISRQPVGAVASPDQTAVLALKAQLKQMTANGVCGQDPQERLPNGGVIFRNRECTEADLR